MSKGNNSRHNDLPNSEAFKDTKSVSSNQTNNRIACFRTRLLRLFNQIQIIPAKMVMILSRLGKLIFSWSKIVKRFSAISALVVATILAGHSVSAQIAPGLNQRPTLASLKTVSISEPDNIKDFVQDKTAALVLGKALFWDMQLGSDGIQSCASCHFHAGADNRSKNQINPGLARVNADRSANPDTTFNTGGKPNYQLTAADYPFHKLANPSDRTSKVLSDSNDIASSQGVFNTQFVDVVPGSAEDKVNPLPDDVFKVGGTNVRRVPSRNTPTAINAVFNFRNFWDGRAQEIFNGVNPFGLRDPSAFVLKAISSTQLTKETVKINNSSLASQAVGPPTNETELSAGGRAFLVASDDAGVISNQPLVAGSSVPAQNDTLFPLASQNVSPEQNLGLEKLPPKNIGKKMLSLIPLGQQIVHPEDSILGAYSRVPELGLNQSYSSLIQTAFKPEWWNSDMIVSYDENNNGTVKERPARPLTTKEITLMEYNFSLFFGLAIQAYESTLVSDDAPIDRYLAGNTNALTREQVMGKDIFEGRGRCINCHNGAELTSASVQKVRNERLKQTNRADGQETFFDAGFFNIGVRPTSDDLGVGGDDPFGNPLSETRLAQQGNFSTIVGSEPNLAVSSDRPVNVDGAFKTPGLRNVELTAPYFHNGGQLTLEQVVDFYNRGGDFKEQNGDNVPLDIRNLNLSDRDKTSLVAFLKTLTDDRVRYEQAPFDHPQIFVPNGHPGNQNSVTDRGNGQATEQLLEVPAVGRNGGNGTPNFLASPN